MMISNLQALRAFASVAAVMLYHMNYSVNIAFFNQLIVFFIIDQLLQDIAW